MVGFVAVTAVAVQLIGPAVIPLGIASITILPMVWGLLVGGIISSQPWRPFPLVLQSTATTIMGVAVLLLCARLAFTMGPNLGLLISAGPALMLQELGHLFGTIALALPLAVLLRMGPATVGATFSIDREGSFAMVADRYGPDSAQYRGVLSMYAFGTLFGAITITIIASMATSLNLFDPLALAMGAGVGSGSMMAAAASVVAEAHPELGDQVLAMAATSNVITGLLGVYVGMYVALPMAERSYRRLTRGRPQEDASAAVAIDAPKAPPVTIPEWTILALLIVVGTIVSSVAAKAFSLDILLGYTIMAIIVAFGLWIGKLTHGKVAPMIAAITLGVLISAPFSPVADLVVPLVSSVDFLTVCTVVLTIAGFTLGKDMPMLRAIGWKIVPVGIVAIASSYLLSVVVAEFALGFWG